MIVPKDSEADTSGPGDFAPKSAWYMRGPGTVLVPCYEVSDDDYSSDTEPEIVGDYIHFMTTAEKEKEAKRLILMGPQEVAEAVPESDTEGKEEIRAVKRYKERRRFRKRKRSIIRSILEEMKDPEVQEELDRIHKEELKEEEIKMRKRTILTLKNERRRKREERRKLRMGRSKPEPKLKDYLIPENKKTLPLCKEDVYKRLLGCINSVRNMNELSFQAKDAILQEMIWRELNIMFGEVNNIISMCTLGATLTLEDTGLHEASDLLKELLKATNEEMANIVQKVQKAQILKQIETKEQKDRMLLDFYMKEEKRILRKALKSKGIDWHDESDQEEDSTSKDEGVEDSRSSSDSEKSEKTNGDVKDSTMYPTSTLPHVEDINLMNDFYKLVTTLKQGDPGATVMALNCFDKMNFSYSTNLKLLKRSRALEIAVNILETNETECQLMALKLIRKAFIASTDLKEYIINLGLIQYMIGFLTHAFPQIHMEAIEFLSIMAKDERLTRTVFRKCDGFGILVDQIDKNIEAMKELKIESNPSIKILIMTPDRTQFDTSPQNKNKIFNWRNQFEKLIPEDSDELSTEEVQQKRSDQLPYCQYMFIYGIRLLHSLCLSPKNREKATNKGLLYVLPKCVKHGDQDSAILAMNIFQKCCKVEVFKRGVEELGYVGFILSIMTSPIDDLRICACRSLARCGSSEKFALCFERREGLPILIDILRKDFTGELKLLQYALGGLLSLMNYPKIFKEVVELPNQIFNLLCHGYYMVVANAGAVFVRMMDAKKNRVYLKDRVGWHKLFVLLNKFIQPQAQLQLLRLFSICIEDKDMLVELRDKRNGLEELWLYLYSDCPWVCFEVTRVLSPLIKISDKELIAENIRCISNSFGICFEMIESDNDISKAAGCNLIEALMNIDEINVQASIELGLLHKCKMFIKSKAVELQECSLRLLVKYARDPKLCFELGELGYVKLIICFLKSSNTKIVTEATIAIYYLSTHPMNCLLLIDNGAVPILLEKMEKLDAEIQEYAAKTLKNIRMFSYQADRTKFYGLAQGTASYAKGVHMPERQPETFAIEALVEPDDADPPKIEELEEELAQL